MIRKEWYRYYLCRGGNFLHFKSQDVLKLDNKLYEFGDFMHIDNQSQNLKLKVCFFKIKRMFRILIRCSFFFRLTHVIFFKNL